MPKIIPYQRRETIPGVSRQVQGSRGNVGPALSELGQSISGIADVLIERKKRLEEQDLVNKGILTSVAYDDEQRAFEADELQKSGQDTYDNITRAEQFRANSISKYTEGIENEKLKSVIEKHIYSRMGGLMDSLSRHQVSQRAEVTKQASDLTLSGILKDVYSGNDLKQGLDRFSTIIKAQNEAGAIGDEEAVDQIVNGEARIAEAHLDGLISRDPVLAIAAIKNGDYSEYLPQEKIEEYDKKAVQIQRDLDERATKAEEKREKQEKEELKQVQEKNAVDYTLQLSETGQIDIVKLRNDLRENKITRQFFNSIITEKEESDDDEVLEIENGILTENINRGSILNNSEITSKEKARLINKFDTLQDKRFKEKYSRGVEQLKARIITTGPLQPLAQGEAERMATAKNELFERLKSEKLEDVLKDMIPRYDSRPDKLSALPSPRFSPKPMSLNEIEPARQKFLEKITNGTIDITSPSGQQAAERELQLLKEYQTIYERMASDAR